MIYSRTRYVGSLLTLEAEPEIGGHIRLYEDGTCLAMPPTVADWMKKQRVPLFLPHLHYGPK